MATRQIDISITKTQYSKLVTELTGLTNKLDALRAPLAIIMQRENGREKILQFIQNNPTEARLLKTFNQLANYCDQFREDVGWREGE